jgi:hypothetical protein
MTKQLGVGLSWLGALALTLAARGVVAQGPGEGEPPRKMDLTTPEPGPYEGRSYKVHNGFYLRGNVGLGSVGVDYGAAHGASFDLALDLMLGGMPSRGFALGGALLTDTMLSADLGAEIGDSNVTVGLLGPFVDGYPDPMDGWHLGAAAGLAGNSVQDLGSGTFIGFGGAAFAGYDFWVGDEWSMGALVRVMATRTWDSEGGNDLDGSTRSLTFIVSALFN